jgi:predicted dehydrogenase
MDTVRFGVVGLGWFGGVLTEGVKNAGVGDIVACFSRSVDARTAFAMKHGCRMVARLDEMLGDPEIDGVLLATPHSTHVDLAVRVAEAGKHVFVEKPLALTVAEAERAADAAHRAGVVLQVGHNRRRQPANRRIKAMVDGGELGTVLQLEGVHTAAGGHRPDLPRWRRDPAEAPLGGMTALGVHTVDTFHYFVGPARRVVAFSKTVDPTPIDDATVVLIEYEQGPLASISTTYFSAPVVSLSVYGSEGAVWNEEDGRRLFTQARIAAAREEQRIEVLDTIVDELAEFANSIRGNGQPETGVRESIEVAAVLEAIGRSVDSSGAVDLAGIR